MIAIYSTKNYIMILSFFGKTFLVSKFFGIYILPELGGLNPETIIQIVVGASILFGYFFANTMNRVCFFSRHKQNKANVSKRKQT